MMNKMLEVPGVLKQDYRGRQAASEVLGISTKEGRVVFRPQDSEFAKMLIPGSFALKSVKKSIEYLNEGDYYNWFLTLNGAPLTNAASSGSVKGFFPKVNEVGREMTSGIASRVRNVVGL